MDIGQALIIDRINKLAPRVGKEIDFLWIYDAFGRRFAARELYKEEGRKAITFEDGGCWHTMMTENIIGMEIKFSPTATLKSKKPLTIPNLLAEIDRE